MADQVDEVKQKTDIVSLVSEYIPLKKAGRNYKALCPFHSEKTPSFMVSPELQMYKCFGCGEAGDAFTFLERYDGMEFGEALRFLAERAGIKLISYRPGEAGEKERLYQINSWVGKFYHYILLNHPIARKALDYLTKERGLSQQSLETFYLGFAPDVPGALKKFLVDKKKVQPRDLETLGLGFFRDGKFLDKFGGRIIFPLFDHRGNIAGFAGRVLPGARPDLAKYINSPETPVYHKSNLLFGLNLTKKDIKNANEVVVTEGELDAISSWQVGVKNVVAIKGSALTEEQVRLLSRFTRRLTLALDTDLAGDTAARRGIAIAQEAGMDIKVARFGEFKDPDEAARANPENYKRFLASAVNVWDFIVDSIFSRHDAGSGEGKAAISREIVPVLAGIPDKIVQAHYLGIVAKRLSVSQEAVSQEVEALTLKEEKEKKAATVVTPQKAEKPRRQLLEERLLTLAFQSDPKILLDKETASLVVTPLTKRLVEEYQGFAKTHISFSPSEFSEDLPKELLEGFAEMALSDTEGLTEDAELLAKELALVKKELKILEVRRKLEETGVKIREFEEGGEKEKLVKAQEEFGRLSRLLSELEEEGRGGIILPEV
ncbi:MAG: DNA primase [Patescibacteria group bacterium]